MSLLACPSTLVRDRSGRLLGAAVVLALASTALVVPAPPAQADSVVAPRSGSVDRAGVGMGSRFRDEPVRRVRGGAQRSDLEADPGLLLRPHPGDHDAERHRAQGVDQRRPRRIAPGAADHRAQHPGWQRRPLHGADGREIQVLADQPLRLGLPADLPHEQWGERDAADRVVVQHLVVLQLGQGHSGCAAQRIRQVLPGLGRTGQARQQRPDGEPGAVGGLRQGCRSGGDADLLAGPGGPRASSGRPVVRSPAARLQQLLGL